ncbi:MAG: thioredoxin-dependent thiol peroxidase [Flavobacteriales bacterium]|nr:thioredoxin-dependent thiol peroxidase [Flavobacteriales bacterium]|tara:strand:+ start:1976 stop:2428 length:453 start_codon:yes stop_codon:yes gene_type:complete
MGKLKEGDLAPEIKAKDQNGEDFELSNLKGKKVVLYFYPKDNTPGCTKQACNLRDNYAELKNAGYEVVGVSADSQKKHQGFISKYDLPFTLLADENKEVIESYEAWGKKKFMGKEYMGIIRKTFVIDEEGKIEQIIEKVKTKEHTSQILN